jgi:hypothetical protein
MQKVSWTRRGIGDRWLGQEANRASCNGGRCPHPRALRALALSLDRERDPEEAEGRIIQWRKWRTPVKTIARPCWSAAAMNSSTSIS